MRPFVGVVHLPPSLGLPSLAGRAVSRRRIEADLDAVICGGADGALLENEHDRPEDLEVSRAQLAWLASVAEHARGRVDLPLGVDVQRLDWRAALAIAAAVGLDFVRLDVFVDRARMAEQEAFDDRARMAEQEAFVDASQVLAERARLGATSVALLTDVHVEHAERLSAMDLETSARAAVGLGSSGRSSPELP